MYQGDFLNGRQSGTGKLKLPNNERYDGQFENGIISGPYGNIYKYKDGRIYEGNFLNGNKHG